MLSFGIISSLLIQSPTILLRRNNTDEFIAGQPLELSVRGLEPRKKYRINGWRQLQKYVQFGSEWKPQNVILHSWGEFMSDAQGEISASAAPMRGTWDRKCDYGILFSGRPFKVDKSTSDDLFQPSLKLQPNQLWITVTAPGKLIDSKLLKLEAPTSGFEFQSVSDNGLVGGFAFPKSKKPVPVVIILHGSEGATPEAARADAVMFAAKGIAAFYLSYARRSWISYPGVPEGAYSVPIERLEAVRSWLARRPEIDSKRIGVLGWSKGGEFSLVASSCLDWIKATVAIVPSDRVWEGYGRQLQPGEMASSWSFRNKSLEFTPYKLSFGDFVEKFPGKNAADWHSYCLDQQPAVVAYRTEIPVENIKSKVLLISSEKDEVWPSARMSRQFAARMKANGKSVQSVTFPKAGHSIVGDGGFPVFLFPQYTDSEGEKFILETGYATIETLKRSVDFLKKNL